MEPEQVAEDPARRTEGDRRAAIVRENPTYGPNYWLLGLAAAAPSLSVALTFATPLIRWPRLGMVPQGSLLALLLVTLAAGSFVAHLLLYPAWSQTWVVNLTVVALVTPATVLHGATFAASAGDPDPVVGLGVLATWLLMLGCLTVATVLALVVGRFAPSFSGIALIPAPLLLTWTIVAPGRFREDVANAALASSFALAALAAFVAWLVPAGLRLYVPLLAMAVQAVLCIALGLGLTTVTGAVRPFTFLDALLCIALTGIAMVMPLFATWMRRDGWPEVRRLLALSR